MDAWWIRKNEEPAAKPLVRAVAYYRHSAEIHGLGELAEFDDTSFEYRRQMWIQIESQRMASSYKPGWSYYRFKDRFGSEPVIADGDLVDPPHATMDQKRAVYKRFVCIADARGYQIGWRPRHHEGCFNVVFAFPAHF